MRKFIGLFVGLSFLFAACNNSGDKDAVLVKGKLENAPNTVLLLKYVKNNQLATLDSASTDADGNFKLKGKIQFEDYLIIQSLDQSQFVQLVASPGEEIELNADFTDMANTYKVSGSVGSVVMQEITKYHMDMVAKVDSLGKMYREYSMAGNVEQIKDQIDSVYRQIIEDEKQYLTEVINKNDSSLVALFALYQQMGQQTPIFHPEVDMPIFEKVSNSLATKLPNSELVKSLTEMVSGFKNPPMQVGAVGTEVPEIEMESPEGKVIKLSEFRGKYVLLDFWAAWCRPCRMENPNIVDNYKKYSKDGFEVFQVSLDQTKEDWVKAIKDDGLNWIHVSDLQYWQSAAARQYNISAIPASFLLDKDGKVIATNLRGPALGEKLKEIFGH
jgi:peroxiredoxin